MSGLFYGDAGNGDAVSDDAVSDDVATDAAVTSDGVADSNGDPGADVGSGDASSNDASLGDRSGDTREPPRDVVAEADMRMDADDEGGTSADASTDGRLDARDGTRDVTSDPRQDPIAEDTHSDPTLDVTIETSVDVAADVNADAPGEDGGSDAAPPGICSNPCNSFANVSPTVTRTVDMGPAPPMTGGTIVDGTYIVSSIVQYNGDTMPYTLSETSVIAGNVDAWVSSINGAIPTRYTTTFTTSNNQMAFAVCCPTPFNMTILYTTDGTTLSHIDPANPNRVITYTRQ